MAHVPFVGPSQRALRSPPMVMSPDGASAQVAGDGGKILSCSLFESYVVCTNLAPAATPNIQSFIAM